MVLFKKKSTICLGIAAAAIILCGTFIICHVARVKSTKNVTACNASSASEVSQASADISEEDMYSLMKNNRKNPSQDNAPTNSSKSSSSTIQATAKNTTSKDTPAQPVKTGKAKKPSQSNPDQCKTVPPKSPQKYASAKFGLSIDFPASWQGKYKVLESENELHVIFKPVSHPVERGGVLFSIIKRTPDLYEHMYDTVGKRYVTNAKGVVFLIGGPTDVGFPTENPEYATYRQMTKELSSVVNTIKSID